MWRLKSSANWPRLPRGFSVVKVSKICYVRRDFEIVMRVIFDAGYGAKDIARMIRSSEPTVRSIARGVSEPKHSQGVYLLAMQKAIKAGTLKPKDKNNE